MANFKAFKFDQDTGKVEVNEGMPVGIFEEEGKDVEKPVDAARMFKTIDNLNNENKKRREKNEELEENISKYSPLIEKEIDPEEALKAMEIAKSIDEKNLVDAEKIAEEKRELQEAHQNELEKLQKEHEQTKKELESGKKEAERKLKAHVVSGQFNKSKFFAGENKKTILPPDIAESKFGTFFDVDENGNTIGYYDEAHEKPIPSRKNYGEPADFDECIEALIEKYPGRDSILKTNGGGPGGSKTGSGPGGNNPFAKETYNVTEQMKLFRENKDLAKNLAAEAGVKLPE